MWPNQPQGNQPPYPTNPGFAPQQGAPSYPPSPYPPAPGYSNPGYPTPGQPYGQQGFPQPQPLGFPSGTSPYPSVPGSSPYPPAPGSSPYPAAPGSSPYPPAPGSSPYPAAPGSSPYPPAPGSSPYPAAPGSSPYPPAPGSSPYPSAPGSSPYPSVPGYSPAPGGSPYHPQGSPSPNQYGYNPTSSPYPTQSVSPIPSGAFAHQALITSSTASQSYAAPAQAKAMQQYQETPTIREGPIDATSDAQILRKAMKGFGTDEAAIINVLAKRTNAQRLQIAQAFKAGYGKDLIKDLKSELGGKLEDVVLALMTPKYEYLAQALHKAMSGIGTKEKVLVDILCTATNHDMQWLNATYSRLYNRTIEKDIRGDTSGHFERLLVSMTTGSRNEDPVANPGIATEDAQKLLQAGEKKWGTDESTFNLILGTRSFAQLRLMFHEYERITGHSFEKAIDKEFSGDVRTGMLAIVKSAKNRAGYFAERLHDSLAGMGTKDNDLIFILVTRAEVDLESIKQEYQRMYGKSLANDVSGDTSGDYKKILLALLG